MKGLIQSLRSFHRCERGTVAIEFSIIGLLMVLIMLGIIAFGRGLLVRNEISYLVDVCSRKVLLDPSIPDTSLQNAARAEFSGDRTNLSVTIIPETIDGISYRSISIAYPMALFMPGLLGGTLTLSISRRVPVG